VRIARKGGKGTPSREFRTMKVGSPPEEGVLNSSLRSNEIEDGEIRKKGGKILWFRGKGRKW